MLVQGVHAIANAAPGDQRSAAPGQAQQRLGMPLAVEHADERRRQEDERPSRRSRSPPTCSSVCLWAFSAEPIAVALSPSRMKIVEKLAMNSRLGTSTRRAPGVLELGRRHADHRRQVAGHERQHAGRKETTRARPRARSGCRRRSRCPRPTRQGAPRGSRPLPAPADRAGAARSSASSLSSAPRARAAPASAAATSPAGSPAPEPRLDPPTG